MNIYIKQKTKYIKVLTIQQTASKLKISRQAVLKRINRGLYRSAKLRLDTNTRHQTYLIPITELKRK